MPTKAELAKRRKQSRERFLRARKAGKVYERQLRQVAKHVGHIVEGMAPRGVVKNIPELKTALERYAELLTPWAKSVSARMVAEVDQRDAQAWKRMAEEIGQGIKAEIKSGAIGADMKARMQEQVDLITSLPRKAAERVHKLTIEALADGTRAREVAKEILRTGEVTESRAMLIARTEVARTAATLTQARAESVGSEGYIWRTSGDSDVRDLHKKLEGKYIPWAQPPIAGENGERAHAGCIYNCRCWAEPILPDRV